mmetsp:Transcript_61495/g.146684  ORF Transcript_61495/g.146684 Transcript_61495/m.146684 type:complete len:108 (-) Transcript_61495:265-588(-)
MQKTPGQASENHCNEGGPPPSHARRAEPWSSMHAGIYKTKGFDCVTCSHSVAAKRAVQCHVTFTSAGHMHQKVSSQQHWYVRSIITIAMQGLCCQSVPKTKSQAARQ